MTTSAANPFSTEAFFEAGELVFKCPTCPSAVRVALHRIDPVVGVHSVCPGCGNVAHVPGAYKAAPKPAGLKITGGVSVTIAQFAEWYLGHPLVVSLIKARESDLHHRYGLWAFCAGCHREYPATVLPFFASAQDAAGFVFTARTTDSAKAMESLTSGRCVSCGHSSLTAIVADIPDYVRSALPAERTDE